MSLENLWRTWTIFRKGKKPSQELDEFEYNLERNLFKLHQDLNGGVYHHGSYRTFVVCDNKRREISVAPVRDRLIHRLIYDHLVSVYDKTFIHGVWSCRKSKGLSTCIEHTQKFLTTHPRGFVWRADIKKFFDSVNHQPLLAILARRIQNPKAFRLIQEVISSFSTAQREREYL